MNEIREQILDRVRKVDDLPAFSRAAQELFARAGGAAAPSLSLAEVARVVEQDPALTARLLRVANTVFYTGRYGEIGDVAQAVTRLGLPETCRLCVTVAALQTFPAASALIDLTDFWKHSIAAAAVSRRIATEAGLAPELAGSAYAAGLLHDIGILMLDRFFGAVYARVRSVSEARGESVYRVERELLGLDHGEIGSLVLERWRFPASIAGAVAWHHEPEMAPAEHGELAAVVHVADFACAALGAVEPGETIPAPAHEAVWDRLGLSIAQLRQLTAETEEEIVKSTAFLQ